MLKVLNKTKELLFDIFLLKKCVDCSRKGEYIRDKCSVFLSESINNIDKLVSIWETELIAKKVGKITKKEVVPLLTKIKDNPSQTSLNYQKRIENVKDIFSFKEEFTCPNNVLVIDDFPYLFSVL